MTRATVLTNSIFPLAMARHVPAKFAGGARFAPAFHADGLEIHVSRAGHLPSITFEMTYVVSSSISTPAVPRRTAPSGLTISTGPAHAAFPQACHECFAVGHARPAVGCQRRGRRARRTRRWGFAVRLLHVGFLARIGRPRRPLLIRFSCRRGYLRDRRA